MRRGATTLPTTQLSCSYPILIVPTRKLRPPACPSPVPTLRRGRVKVSRTIDRSTALQLRLSSSSGVNRKSSQGLPGVIGPPCGHLTSAHLGKLVSAALGGGWTAHTIRHRYGTLAYSVDRDLRAVQELMGHQNIETTTVYTKVPDGAMRRATAASSLVLSAL